jgi:hypothetical protein
MPHQQLYVFRRWHLFLMRPLAIGKQSHHLIRHLEHRANFSRMPDTDTDYNPNALFDENGPINPLFVTEAVRTLMRAMPLVDEDEPHSCAYRRMYASMSALAAMHPRDEIELMLGIQAISAYQAAAALWRVGMNVRQPAGESTRHISAAATATRTFDSLLKALERRQAKPLAVPIGRPPPREWPQQDTTLLVRQLERRCRQAEDDPEPTCTADHQPIIWKQEAVDRAEVIADEIRIEEENAGLDIANTEGIRPDGSIIMPKSPTPQQEAYLARRVGLRLRREWAENQRQGINEYPKLHPIRAGDIVP